MEMELGFDLEDCDLEVDDLASNFTNGVKLVSESTLIPSRGVFLGLDISLLSSGICLYEDGKKYVFNSSLEDVPEGDFYEVRLRKSLKIDLLEVIGDREVDLIIIEDAYQGINPQTTRVLYAINTAIDELILDGACKCKKFLRVENGTWKSWLYKVDTEGRFKGLKDKVRIQKCLELLGVTESGAGFQDRLDACGMILGYFLDGYKSYIGSFEEGIKIFPEDIRYAFSYDIEGLKDECRKERGEDELEIVYCSVGNKALTKKMVRELLKSNKDKLVVIKEERALGAFGAEIGICNVVSCVGHLGFWLCRNKYKKLNANGGSLKS
jgi:hypothetical protein